MSNLKTLSHRQAICGRFVLILGDLFDGNSQLKRPIELSFYREKECYGFEDITSKSFRCTFCACRNITFCNIAKAALSEKLQRMCYTEPKTTLYINLHHTVMGSDIRDSTGTNEEHSSLKLSVYSTFISKLD